MYPTPRFRYFVHTNSDIVCLDFTMILDSQKAQKRDYFSRFHTKPKA